MRDQAAANVPAAISVVAARPFALNTAARLSDCCQLLYCHSKQLSSSRSSWIFDSSESKSTEDCKLLTRTLVPQITNHMSRGGISAAWQVLTRAGKQSCAAVGRKERERESAFAGQVYLEYKERMAEDHEHEMGRLQTA